MSNFPKLEVPVLTCTLPISGKTVKYRPYTVKEDKILNLITTEKDEQKLIADIVGVVSDLAKVCTFDKVNIDILPVPDVEYLFLKIKGASAGSVRKKIYACKLEDEDGEVCGKENIVEIDLDDVKLSGDMPVSLIKLDDTTSLSLKPPTFAEVKKAMETGKNKAEASMKTLAAAVDMVLVGEETFSEFTEKELIDNILNNMTEQQLTKMKTYFESLPELVLQVKFDCTKCKATHEIEVKHLVNFFG